VLADVDPIELLRSVGERMRVLHLKDESSPGEPAPIGSGRCDTPAILAAAGAAEWHIVEYEARDNVLEGIEESYRFLVERGLSRGRR
jgi:sugar phosphate isomerase/epimerase